MGIEAGRLGGDALWVARFTPGEIGAAEGEFVYAGRAREAEDGVAVFLGEDVIDDSPVGGRGTLARF